MLSLVGTLAALIAIGVRAARALGSPGESRATAATRGGLAAMLAVVVVQSALGAAGLLPAGTFPALVTVALASWALGRRAGRSAASTSGPRPARPPWTAGEAALAAALVAVWVLRLVAGLHKTTFLYDTLSYHLHVPASWLHAGRLAIVPAVFGDVSPAYAPSNLELWFLLLMGPLRSDALATVGQLPLGALASTAIAAVVREAGGARAGALAAALAFLLVPEVWGQAPTAMVDLGMAAFLLATLPFAARLYAAPPAADTARDLAAAVAALGLAAGTKYVGLVLAVPFAAVLVHASIRRRARLGVRAAGAAAGLLIAAGGFWYLRNLAVTGNPIYPAAVPGLPLPALYDGAAMRAWDYHVPVAEVGVLLSSWGAAGLGFAVSTVVALVVTTRPRRAAAAAERAWPSGAELALVTSLVALHWLALPYQESRFLFAAFGVAAVALGRAASRADGRSASPLGRGLLVFTLFGGWLALPARDQVVVPTAAAVVALAARGWRGLPAQRRRPALVGLACVAGLAVAIGAGALARDVHRSAAPGFDPGYAVDDGTAAAWRWFRAHARQRRVAYTGTNLGFPLAGAGLENRVHYVNISGEPADLIHDFGRRARAAGPGSAGPRPAPSPEPALHRRGATFDRWLANLRALHIDVVYVAALYAIVRRTHDADAEGFPVERAWADAHPDLFALRYASDAARIYELAR